MTKTMFTIKGTHCASCKVVLEEICREVPGVIACTIDYRTGETELEYEPTLEWAKLKQAIDALGQYRVELPPA